MYRDKVLYFNEKVLFLNNSDTILAAYVLSSNQTTKQFAW